MSADRIKRAVESLTGKHLFTNIPLSEPVLYQILITKVEQPVDEPKGEVFKVTVFDDKTIVDCWHYIDEGDVLECVKGFLPELKSL